MINFIQKNSNINLVDKTPTQVQRKEIEITDNGNTVVKPDGGYLLSQVDITTNVPEKSLKYATNIGELFFKADFSNLDTFTFTIPPNCTDYYRLFREATGLNTVKVINPKEESVRGYEMFYKNKAKVCDLTEFNCRFSNANGLFHLSDLREIRGVVDFSDCTEFKNTFANSYYLKEVRFKPNCIKANLFMGQSDQYSEASLNSLADGLYNFIDGEVHQVSFSRYLKIPDYIKAKMTAKNWTVVQ